MMPDPPMISTPFVEELLIVAVSTVTMPPCKDTLLSIRIPWPPISVISAPVRLTKLPKFVFSIHSARPPVLSINPCAKEIWSSPNVIPPTLPLTRSAVASATGSLIRTPRNRTGPGFSTFSRFSRRIPSPFEKLMSV